jgi:hypothetical protein
MMRTGSTVHLPYERLLWMSLHLRRKSPGPLLGDAMMSVALGVKPSVVLVASLLPLSVGISHALLQAHSPLHAQTSCEDGAMWGRVALWGDPALLSEAGGSWLDRHGSGIMATSGP